MITNVSFKAKGGGDVSGALAEPPGSDKAPAVILVQEWWGVNDHVRDLVNRLAKEGFLVLAPDLYHGKVTKDPDEAMKLMNAMDTLQAVKEVAGAVAFLKEHPRGNGKVGITGFCMGGAVSFASACHVEGLSAVVPFYGIPPADKVDYKKVGAPIQAHVGKKDGWVTPEKVEDIKRQLDAQKQPMEIHVYDADHAFVNDTRPEVYDAAKAKLAWERMVAFLKKHVA